MSRTYYSNLIDYSLAIFLAGILGAAFLLTKIALQEIPFLSLTTARILIGFIVLYIIMRIERQNFPKGIKIWSLISICAVFGYALPFTLVSWGQNKVDAGLSSILMSIMPLSTILIAHFFTEDEKLNIFKILGILLGIIGIILLIGIEKITNLGGINLMHQYAILLAAVCYAINAVMTKSLISLTPKILATSMLLSASIMLLPFSLVIDHPWELSISMNAFLATMALGILPTAVGAVLIVMVVVRRGASFLSKINFMVPIFGIFWAMFFLSESPPKNAFLALFIILLGIAISGIKPSRAKLFCNVKAQKMENKE